MDEPRMRSARRAARRIGLVRWATMLLLPIAAACGGDGGGETGSNAEASGSDTYKTAWPIPLMVVMVSLPFLYKSLVSKVTPASRIAVLAAASDPSRSIARQASSRTTTSKPSLAASCAEKATQKSVASPQI